jgi:hypothetical protein
MDHTRQSPIQLTLDRASGGSGTALFNAVSILPEKDFFAIAARAALIGCELHRVHLGHVTLYRLQCLDSAMVLSQAHDVQAAITARGAA